jgi:hypothetical protein
METHASASLLVYISVRFNTVSLTLPLPLRTLPVCAAVQFTLPGFPHTVDDDVTHMLPAHVHRVTHSYPAGASATRVDALRCVPPPSGRIAVLGFCRALHRGPVHPSASAHYPHRPTCTHPVRRARHPLPAIGLTFSCISPGCGRELRGWCGGGGAMAARWLLRGLAPRARPRARASVAPCRSRSRRSCRRARPSCG